jgi:hypothetical protein
MSSKNFSDVLIFVVKILKEIEVPCDSFEVSVRILSSPPNADANVSAVFSPIPIP